MPLKDPARTLSLNIVAPAIAASASAAVGYPYLGLFYLLVFSAYPVYLGLLTYFPVWPTLAKITVICVPLTFLGSIIASLVFESIKVAFLIIFIFFVVGTSGAYQAKIQQDSRRS